MLVKIHGLFLLFRSLDLSWCRFSNIISLIKDLFLIILIILWILLLLAAWILGLYIRKDQKANKKERYFVIPYAS